MPLNNAQAGAAVVTDGDFITPRIDNYGNTTIQHGGPFYMELTRRGYGFVYSQAAAGVNLFIPIVTALITTGAFVAGRRYKIVNVGDTTWTNIGASAATVGIEFVATGIGDGTTGTATLMSSNFMIWNQSMTNTYFIPTKITLGFLGSTAIVAGDLGIYMLTSVGDSSGVITYTNTTSVANTYCVATPVQAQIGYTPNASNMVFCPAGEIITTLPTFYKTLPFTELNNDYSGKNMASAEIDLDGSIIVKPNNAFFIAPNVNMASLAVISVHGFELPIPPGSI
jgi:hypothetical protein